MSIKHLNILWYKLPYFSNFTCWIKVYFSWYSVSITCSFINLLLYTLLFFHAYWIMSLKSLYYRFIGFSGVSDIILLFSAKNQKVQFKCQSFIWGNLEDICSFQFTLKNACCMFHGVDFYLFMYIQRVCFFSLTLSPWPSLVIASAFCPCCCCCYVTSIVSDSVRPYRRKATRLLHSWVSAGKNTGMGCHFLLQCMKVKSES